jgi:uncharacterized membrane protein YphA (DoxX/SURF4 family)
VFIALVVATVLLAGICLNSATMKLRRHEQVLAVISGTVSVPQQYLPVLAALEVAGAAGILIGLWLEPLGVLAAACLVAYFVGAVGGHLRVKDFQHLVMPLPPLVLAIVVLVLRLVTV